MKLTIIAATGGVGRHLLRQALDAGHDVTARRSASVAAGSSSVTAVGLPPGRRAARTHQPA